MNPAQDGIPEAPKRTHHAPDGDEMLLINGIEQVTHSIWRGRAISPHAYRSYRKLIQVVDGLKIALDMRIEQQGGGQ